MKLLSNIIDEALDGGFGRLAYRTLAWTFVVAIVSEIATNGLTDTVYVYGVLLAGMLINAYGD